jgi:hypothetical protein
LVTLQDKARLFLSQWAISSKTQRRKNANSMENLTSYLNDHLAGSVGALELLDRLIDTYKEKPLERFFIDLRNEISADQETLKELIASLGEEESTVRKAGAWVIEKFSRGKIQLGAKGENEMGLFLALEGLALGIHGKRSLWCGLATASETASRLRGPDYETLEKRAMEQHDRVEAKRLEVAREVFKSN